MFTLDDDSDLDNVSSGLWLDICIQIPDEEKDLGAHDRLIHVYHFSRDASQNHMV
jgi:ubiquitin carboxyl-terminal hydrolase 7